MHLLYHAFVNAGQLVREARLRAGLTQRRVAELARLSQPTVARIERGSVEPTCVQVNRLIEACGLELRVGLVPADDADWSVARANLELDVDARVRQHQAAVRFIESGRRALNDASA